jgi:hypothetical protein
MTFQDWIRAKRIEAQWVAAVRHWMSPRPTPSDIYLVGFGGLSAPSSGA